MITFKLKVWQLLIAVVIVLLVGMYLDRQFFHAKPEIVERVVVIPDLTYHANIEEATKHMKIVNGDFAKYFSIPRGVDTFLVDSGTPYGSIPVTETPIYQPIIAMVDNQEYLIGLTIVITHRGEIFSADITPDRTEIKTRLVQYKPPTAKFFGEVDIETNQQLQIFAMGRIGILVKQRVGVYIGGYADPAQKLYQARAGVKFVF